MGNQDYTTGRHEDSNPCPIRGGGDCVEPERRKKIYTDWGINIPTIIAFIMLMGSLIGYIVTNERRMTENKENLKTLEVIDKGIIQHGAAVESIAIRDRAEMRDDIKEIKQMMIQLIERRR